MATEAPKMLVYYIPVRTNGDRFDFGLILVLEHDLFDLRCYLPWCWSFCCTQVFFHLDPPWC